MKYFKSDMALHPYAIGLVPVAYLYYVNHTQTSVRELLLAGLVICTAIYALSKLMKFVFGASSRTNIALSLCVAMFFMYGVLDSHLNRFIYVRQRYVIILWTLLLLISVFCVLKSKKGMNGLGRYLNIATVVMLFIILSRLTLSVYSTAQANISMMDSGSDDGPAVMHESKANEFPDIYYIILDGMASSRTFRDVFDYDNGEFIRALQEKGFYVASDSSSNYPCTMLSLASSLNMRYINDLSEYDEHSARHRAYQMIRDNAVMRKFRSKGYRIVNVQSGWGVTDYNWFADENLYCGLLSEYVSVLINQTPISSLFKKYVYKKEVRDRIVKMFRRIPGIDRDNGRPNFVFAHIVCPHPPFVFGKNGGWIKVEERRKGENVWSRKGAYLDQAIYVMSSVLKMVDAIQKRSTTPYVILLQGDHGTASTFPDLDSPGWSDPTDANIREAFGILNAYFVPKSMKRELYKTISPVNSFKVILGKLFGEDISLSDDKSYYSYFDQPFRLLDVTTRVQPSARD